MYWTSYKCVFRITALELYATRVPVNKSDANAKPRAVNENVRHTGGGGGVIVCK